MRAGASSRAKSIAPSATLAISALTKKLQSEGRKIIGFGAGEPDMGPPAHVLAAMEEALKKGDTRYTAAAAAPLKQAICDRMKEEIGVPYSPDEVVVSCGAKHSLFNLFEALLEPGDEVILPAPYWLSYPEMIRIGQGIPKVVEPEANGLPSLAALEKACGPRTKALLINSPSNPSGVVWPPELIKAAAELAKARDLWIVSDEIYERLIFGTAKHLSAAAVSPDARARTFVVNGVSKAYAMTGLRIGYCLGDKAVIKALAAFQSHSTSDPASPSQAGALAALKGSQDSVEAMRKTFEKRRDLGLKVLSGAPKLKTPRADGAFYLFPDVSAYFGTSPAGRKLDSADSLALACLEEAGVAIVAGESFGAPKNIRISYACSEKDIEEGLGKFVKFLNEIKL